MAMSSNKLAAAVLFLVVAASIAVPGKSDCTYTLEVKTADELYAGTDSGITFTVFSSRVPKEYSWSYNVIGTPSNFERGVLDTFTVNNFCMYPCRLKVRSDGWGIGSGWKLEYVRITVSGGASYQTTFTVNDWIEPLQGKYEVDINNCGNHLPLEVTDQQAAA